MGTYKKEIIANYAEPPYGMVKPRLRGSYLYYEIKVNTKVVFKLKVIKAKNEAATKENVYWVAQAHTKFKSKEWLDFKTTTKSGKTRNNRVALHTFLNNLNIGTKYEKAYLEDGSKNKDYRHYTFESTKAIGKKYFPANPYEDRFTKRDTEETALGDFAYKVDHLGAGIWLEGINYTPEFGAQGAFIIAVDKPQILSFYVEKRHEKQSEVQKKGIIACDTDHVEQELVYGDIMDLHLRLHNVFNYKAKIEVFCEGQNVNDIGEGYFYYKEVRLPEHYDMENPSKDYNLDIIDELVADIRWAANAKHEPGEDTESSLKTFKLKLTLDPIKSKEKPVDNRPKLKREVSFTVNYRGDFSPEEQEHKYVARIVKVRQVPLVSQSFEDCKYTTLKLTNGDKTLELLKEEENGALTELRKDNKTPYYEFVAGNALNRQEINIAVNSKVKTCTEEVSHKNNVFNTDSIEIFDYTKKKEETIWGKLKAFVHATNIFDNVQPYTEVIKTEDQLKFKAAYPYNAFNETTFLLRYLSFQLDPVPLDISVTSCRYRRTPTFLIHPDVVWAVHTNYNPDKILYYNNEEVALVQGHADYMSHIASGLDWLNNKLKPFVEDFLRGPLRRERKESWDKVQNMISEFVEDNTTTVSLGFYAKYDNSEIINYSETEPCKSILNYYIFQMVLLSIGVEIFLLYLTKGKVSPGMAKLARAAKKYEKVKKRVNDFKEKHDLSFEMPKLSSNFAIHRAQQPDFGEVATIFEYTLKADPFLAISTDYKFIPEQLPEALTALELKAVVKGKIEFDINIKYNTLTRDFTLNNNAKHQKGGSAVVLKNGDIVQLEGYIVFNLKAKGGFKHEFNLWNFLPFNIGGKGKLELHSAVGITRRFGVDAQRGPFLEDKFFFEGLKGSYMQKIKVKISDREVFGSNKKNEEEPISLFENKSISLGPIYLFEIFSNPNTRSNTK